MPNRTAAQCKAMYQNRIKKKYNCEVVSNNHYSEIDEIKIMAATIVYDHKFKII